MRMILGYFVPAVHLADELVRCVCWSCNEIVPNKEFFVKWADLNSFMADEDCCTGICRIYYTRLLFFRKFLSNLASFISGRRRNCLRIFLL